MVWNIDKFKSKDTVVPAIAKAPNPKVSAKIINFEGIFKLK